MVTCIETEAIRERQSIQSRKNLLIKIKNSLSIYEEDTKENHNRVVSLCVIKTRLLFSSNFLGLENIHFQTWFTNCVLRGLFFKPLKKLALRALSDLKHLAIVSCFISDKALLLVVLNTTSYLKRLKLTTKSFQADVSWSPNQRQVLTSNDLNFGWATVLARKLHSILSTVS